MQADAHTDNAASNHENLESEVFEIEDLRRVPLFANLDDGHLTKLAAMLERCEYAAGQIVFYEHDAGDALYIIKTGRVEVTTHDAAAQSVRLAEIEAGGFFGELALIDGAERSATVRTLDDCGLLKLTRHSFQNFLIAEPQVALLMMREMSERVRHTNRLVQERVARNVNAEQQARMTFGERIADKVATFGGSWTFVIIFSSILLLWMTLNAFFAWRMTGSFGGDKGTFDPFPFILLNLLLSTMSAFQAPIIMMSQNRSSEKDRLAAENDYQVNLKSELLLEQLTRRVERLQNVQLAELLNRVRELEKK